MTDLRFLKRDRGLLYAALLIPLAFYFDTAVMTWIRDCLGGHGMTFLHYLGSFAYIGGNGATLIPFSVVLFLLGGSYGARMRRAGKYLFFGLVSAGLTVQLLKHLVGRARPRVTDYAWFVGPSLDGGFDSFPSGHTAMAFCFAYTLSAYYPRCRFFLYPFAFLVAIGRVGSTSHFPSDVIGGALLGVIIGRILSGGSGSEEAGPERAVEKVKTG